MIFAKPTPFDEALSLMRAKQLLPMELDSAQYQELSADLTRRAMFSARVSNAQFLQRAQDMITEISGGSEDRSKAMMTIPETKARLKEFLDSIGYAPEQGQEGSIKDLSSDRRLQLIVETNLLDAQGYGRWKSGQDPDALDNLPAWELVRMIDSRVPRDWESRWDEAFQGEPGATESASGRMVAIKNHPGWARLGSLSDDSLGNPWPPFAFNSGMNVIDVTRDEAIGLGVIAPETVIDPQDKGINDNFEVSAAQFDEALQKDLANLPGIELVDGILRLKNRKVIFEDAPVSWRPGDSIRNRIARAIHALDSMFKSSRAEVMA